MYLTNFSARTGMDTWSILKQSLTNFEFRVFLLLRWLLKDGRMIVGFIPFLRVFVRCENVNRLVHDLNSSLVSIFLADNNHTTTASIEILNSWVKELNTESGLRLVITQDSSKINLSSLKNFPL